MLVLPAAKWLLVPRSNREVVVRYFDLLLIPFSKSKSFVSSFYLSAISACLCQTSKIVRAIKLHAMDALCADYECAQVQPEDTRNYHAIAREDHTILAEREREDSDI